MTPQNPSEPSTLSSYTPRPPQQRVSSTDLMRGGRDRVLLHDGQEYILRITRTGKLILTK